MNAQAQVHLRDKWLWSRKDRTYTRGGAFDESSLLSSDQLASLFASVTGRDRFLATLRHLKGFFAVVRVESGSCWLAVDRVRSIPLFYGFRNGHVCIGDDSHEVERRLGNREMSEVSRAEFLQLGYVTGRDTLCPHVKQCLAGEAVFIEVAQGKTAWVPCRYYQYKHQTSDDRSHQQLVSDHERVLGNVFGRLIAWADGRTIVIPLSGGHDSRLVALMLHKLDYRKVIAINYGRPGSRQSVVSSRVAAALGFDWRFVPYSNHAWARWYHSDERVAYQRYAGGLASIAHIQDWPAIWQLTQEGTIPSDGVVVPGHTGDFVAGGRSLSAPDLYREDKINLSRIVEASINYHYRLWPEQAADDPLWPSVVERLRQQIKSIISESAENNASVFETWNWENRQAKFIVNSVRVYDFYKLAWWLPLWDSEYLGFWARVPLKHKRGKRWYDSFVDALYRRVTGKSARTLRPISMRLGRYLCQYRWGRAIRQFVKRPSNRTAAHANQLLCLYGFIPEDQFRSLYTPKRNVNSFLAAEALGEITIRDPRTPQP